MNLNQVTVPSINLLDSLTFYSTLGLQLIVKSLPNYLRFQAPTGDATFSVHLVHELPQGPGISIYFECENLDEQVAKLQAQGIKFDELPEDKSWAWREARLKDPSGNQLILFYGGTYRKDPPWRVA